MSTFSGDTGVCVGVMIKCAVHVSLLFAVASIIVSFSRLLISWMFGNVVSINVSTLCVKYVLNVAACAGSSVGAGGSSRVGVGVAARGVAAGAGSSVGAGGTSDVSVAARGVVACAGVAARSD